MYCPEKLKLNKHQVIAIPRPREIFGRVGSFNVPQNLYTGDDVAPEQLSKVEELARTEKELLAKLDKVRDNED